MGTDQAQVRVRSKSVPALLFLLAALFFLSGTSALIYQMLMFDVTVPPPP